VVSELNTAGNTLKAPRMAHLLTIIVFGFAPFQSIAQEVSPTEPFADRDTYYPNSEALAKDEMRVIACGTGMPTTRASQAAACFLVELGNGDKFIFDAGSGSAERIS